MLIQNSQSDMHYPIPYGKQNIDENDIAAVLKALQSDYLTQGPVISEFESKFANYINCKYAVAVANGTAALHLAAMSLGVNENSNVITTPITFAASANCIRYCGGNVFFADIDPETYLIDLQKVRALLDSNPPGLFTGIIPVDFAGNAVDMEECKKLADEYNLWIIEDACHSPGGFFIDSNGNRQNCGNGTFADCAVFSFHPVKHIACGEGGMITTNDEKLYRNLLKYRTHGITKNKDLFTLDINWAASTDLPQDKYPGWYMEMQDLGFNYRLTDFQAALGITQLQKAEDGIKRRKEIAFRYQEAFINKEWIYGQSGVVEGHAYHLYIIEVENRLGLYNHLLEKNIFPQVHYIPTHLMPYYRNLGFKEGDMPAAENYYSRCLSLPMYPTLTVAEQGYVIETIIAFFES